MIRTFMWSESGAVTVDWVVLTAAIAFLGMAAASLVTAAAEEPSTGISNQMAQDIVGQSSSFGLAIAIEDSTN